jgi:hypothetical protein
MLSVRQSQAAGMKNAPMPGKARNAIVARVNISPDV